MLAAEAMGRLHGTGGARAGDRLPAAPERGWRDLDDAAPRLA